MAIVPLLDRLSTHLSLRPSSTTTQVLTLGEGWIGAARGERNYLGMVVSTGVGGGVVVDGRLLAARRAMRGTSDTSSSSPKAAVGCGARGSSRPRCPGEPSGEHWRTGRAGTHGGPRAGGTLIGSRRFGRLAARSAVGSRGGSVALGFGDPFFNAAQRELERSARSTSRVERAYGGPDRASCATGRRGGGRLERARGQCPSVSKPGPPR